jgi:hypothetical protein
MYATSCPNTPDRNDPTLVYTEVARAVLFHLSVVIIKLVFEWKIESTKFYAHDTATGGLTIEEIDFLVARQ